LRASGFFRPDACRELLTVFDKYIRRK